MDGKPVKSCTILAAMCEGHEIRTVESLETDGKLDPVQEGFDEKHALQCGFCTPGMLMTARILAGLAVLGDRLGDDALAVGVRIAAFALRTRWTPT